MTRWKTLESKKVFTNPWYSVRQDQVLNHNGKELTYSVIELRSPSVFIIAANDRGEILLHRSYRYAIDKELWEVPAGHSDGEDLLSAAKRELLEETGLVSDDWTSLGTLYQAAGIGSLPMEVFLAKKAYATSDERDEDEDITSQRFIPPLEVAAMAKNGELQNAPVLAALYLATLHGI